ncbi:MarR family winged helix-turn-helix transcriptional regulator [Nocardioides sp. NPDC047086]|uniref:MarR family winged helix-turn-helix transcriptional regulator n=1 Tax=Nocardioides sp. NPDC047086 TaxID=3154810 RepID=UPI0033F1163C
MEGNWLSPPERVAWVRFIAVLELLPGALDSQLRRDAGLTHFEYGVLAMLSEVPDHTLRMTELAGYTSATLPRLSNVVKRLADRGLIERHSCPGDRRATNVRLTEAGREKMVASAPGHVDAVREYVFDALTPDQVDQLSEIAAAVLERLDPTGAKRPPIAPGAG